MKIGVDGYPVSGPRAGVGRYCAELLMAVALRCPELKLDVLAHRTRRRSRQGSVADIESAGVNIIRRPRVLNMATEALHRTGLPVRYDVLLPRQDAYFFPRYWTPATGNRPALTMIYDLSCYVAPEAGEADVVERLRKDIRSTVCGSGAIGVISNAVARELSEMFPDTRGRITLLRPGLSLTVAHQQLLGPPASLSPGYVLHVGTLEPRKNLITLIRAVTSLATEPSVSMPRLVLAGRPGWLHGPILNAIADAGQVVHWIPDASDDDLARLYANAAVTVVASRYEGFGLPLLEAMALGSPVLCSDIPVFHEVGGNVVTYCDTSNLDALADAIQTQLQMTPADRLDLTEAGRRRAREFNWSATALDFASTFRSLVEHGSLTGGSAWSPNDDGSCASDPT